MLCKLQMKLKFDKKCSINMSSLFHGFLMENIDVEYASKMHENALRPYSTNLRMENDEWIWTVNTLNEESEDKIINKLRKINNIYLKNKDISADIVEKNIKTIMYDELLKKYYFSDNSSKYIDLSFITPTAFKIDNKYIIFPVEKSIFLNLIKRYDSFAKKIILFSEGLQTEIEDKIHIVKYKLNSVNFHLEGNKIPAFRGNIYLKVNGNDSFINMINMLAEYGEYSGVGIKSAIGMGAMIINKNGGKNE